MMFLLQNLTNMMVRKTKAKFHSTPIQLMLTVTRVFLVISVITISQVILIKMAIISMFLSMDYLHISMNILSTKFQEFMELRKRDQICITLLPLMLKLLTKTTISDMAKSIMTEKDVKYMNYLLDLVTVHLVKPIFTLEQK